jgi:hypothetical protein
MTPIYATTRAQLAGWYAYHQPGGRYVIWDGGINTMQTSTGLWCPFTGNIVDAPDALLKNLPELCVAGYMHGEEIIVTSLPHPDEILPVSPFTRKLKYFDFVDPHVRVPFLEEVIYGPELLAGTSCRMVDVEQLPDDDTAALAHLIGRYGVDGVARHPWSTWTPKRSSHMATTLPPIKIENCRIREIHCTDQMNLIDFVQVWATIEQTMNVTPLYPGDDEVESDFWTIHKPITLYSIGDQIVGYE